jgi:hypothetical protein
METCAMKPREQGGVVDPRLDVYGTRNLKVAGTFSIALWVDDTNLNAASRLAD